VNEILPTCIGENGIILTDSYTGQVMSTEMDATEENQQILEKKAGEIQEVSDLIENLFVKFRDTNGQNVNVRLIASHLFHEHNTNCASIIRTLRAGLECYAAMAQKRGKIDGRNEVAVEWIERGKGVDTIPFI
jgi:hypothetical protein